MNEAERQRALLRAVQSVQSVQAGHVGGAPELALREAGPRAARGLEAYRANAQALADRALGAAFPTVRLLVGAETFARLAADAWQAHPPQRGDIGVWGDAYAAWLQARPALSRWPYLGDVARLDWALHHCERAADAVLDSASLGRLESADPQHSVLHLMPGSALLLSPWPIAQIHAAHQLEGDAAEAAFGALRVALAEPSPERVLVVRRGWRARVHALDGPAAAFTQQVLEGATLHAALEHAGAGFDFAGWLGTALRESWLQRVAAVDD